MSPYNIYKEVKTAHKRTKNTTHKRPQAPAFVCSVFVPRLCRVGVAVAVCYAMKEKIELLRSLAESILDELAEMEVIASAETEIHTNGYNCADGN